MGEEVQLIGVSSTSTNANTRHGNAGDSLASTLDTKLFIVAAREVRECGEKERG